jgi:hypothetical protein
MERYFNRVRPELEKLSDLADRKIGAEAKRDHLAVAFD